MKEENLTEKIIGCAISVHRAIGPGLLESTYEECMAYEFRISGLHFHRQKPVPLKYKTLALDNAYRLDFLVEEKIVLELKSIDHIMPIHLAQMLTYLRMGNWSIGLLINFNVPKLTEGIKRVVL